MKKEEVLSIIDKHRDQGDGLISVLEEIQTKYSYLPAEALKLVAERTGRSAVDVYSVATFYRSFSLKPRGKHLCLVCQGTACHVRGAPQVEKEFARQLQVQPGETTPDREFTLETVNCLGACALGPVVVMDGHYFSNVRTSRVKSILDKTRAGLDDAELKADLRDFVLTVSCPRCNHSLMDPHHPIDGSPSIKVTVATEGEHGWLRLSALYGSFTVESEFGIRTDAVVDFFCPHCHAVLKGASLCPLPQCRAPMVSMIVRAGGVVQICSRRGCKGHMLDLNGSGV
ncbi:MAG TPA: NAD(P)H-dependent oxidoreductase subunit E [Phycisphaerae bacterium]|nr:NAD(P)H-dependent oxidoreductase subunit E [Phycisphaerae bacterium]HNU44635.1 NAD(P)H-dependent oxidoreductase subunit E [Phycisphaerae bacterium]